MNFLRLELHRRCHRDRSRLVFSWLSVGNSFKELDIHKPFHTARLFNGFRTIRTSIVPPLDSTKQLIRVVDASWPY